jgi:uncharacterized membrane protein (DUF106 family)
MISELWYILCNGIFDLLLGWLLSLSWTATLVVVAVATGVILAVVRKLATDQDRLRRADEDKKTLKKRIREAKKRRDKDAVRRMRTTRSMIALRTFSQEGKPLLLAILPIAILATWCFNRLGYHPPAGGEEIEVVFYAPVSAVGEVMHLVPREGLTADRWVQPVTTAEVQGQPTGLATWIVRGEARPEPYRLTFRLRDRTFDKGKLLVGQPTYSPPLTTDEAGEIGAELKMRQAKFLGLIPGLGAFLPPWLVAYLILVIPLAVVIKRVLRIH